MDEMLSGLEWSVDFKFDGEELRAEIVGRRSSPDIEYAFYLMRGVELVAKIWYSVSAPRTPSLRSPG